MYKYLPYDIAINFVKIVHRTNKMIRFSYFFNNFLTLRAEKRRNMLERPNMSHVDGTIRLNYPW